MSFCLFLFNLLVPTQLLLIGITSQNNCLHKVLISERTPAKTVTLSVLWSFLLDSISQYYIFHIYMKLSIVSSLFHSSFKLGSFSHQVTLQFPYQRSLRLFFQYIFGEVDHYCFCICKQNPGITSLVTEILFDPQCLHCLLYSWWRQDLKFFQVEELSFGGLQ